MSILQSVALITQDSKMLDQIDRNVKSCHSCFYSGEMPFNAIMQCLESRLIKEALESTGGNQSEAARKLGLKLSTFRDKLRKQENCLSDS